MSRKHDREPYPPNVILIPPPDAPPDAPTDALSASQAALTRAASAAEDGNLFRADRESRLAERLDRLGRRARDDAPAPDEEENDGESFRLDLERRINLYRIEERKQMDALKRDNPQAWRQAYEAALAHAREDGGIKHVEAFWTGDPRLFDEPEGGYPPVKVV